MRGTVIKNTGSWYLVRTEENVLYQCKVKGNLRLRGIRSTNPVAVGDHVVIDEIDAMPQALPAAAQASAEGYPLPTGRIADILDRRNYIIRRASNLSKQSHIIAANIDQACLIATIAHPDISTTFIDRFLASAEAYRVPVVIVFNKSDLYDEDDLRLLEAVTHLYRTIGYTCLHVSALTGEGTDALRQALADRTTLFSGNSGVGKSTLLNLLVPEACVRTAELSDAHDQGMHTTTFSEMFDLPFGGHVIDTPGIRGFGTFDMERAEVSHYFRDIFSTGRACRFADCTHTGEPGCAVKKALDNHEIAQSRYTSYLSMLEDKDEDRYRH